MAINPAQFDAVVDALRRVLPCERPADAVLSAYFRDMRKLGAQDRHLIAETIFAVLRRRAFLTALTAPSATPRRLVIASLIKVRGLNVRELDGILTEAEKKWVVELKAAHPELDLAGRAELPEWVVDALRAGGQDDDAIVALGHSMQNSAPLDLRANTLKMRRDDVLAALRAAGLELAPTPFSPVGLRVKGKPPINRHPLFLEGAVEVQDEGSQLLSLLVGARRGEMVVDFCAGAGGKTLHIAAMMEGKGRLLAMDVEEWKLENLKQRARRAGAHNVETRVITSSKTVKRLKESADRVLLDVPCSGLGVLKRNPDAKWRDTAERLPVLVALKEWLDRMVPKVVPDTKLGDAISYTRNQWEYLTRYTEDGRMPIDNNLLERDIRVFATGRKSWLFCDTVDGAKASAVIYSLMLTCRACGVEPFAWLRHVFTEMPQRPDGADINDLLPFNFAKTAPD